MDFHGFSLKIMIFQNYQNYQKTIRENEEKIQKCETEKFLICISKIDSAGRIACARWLDMITKKNVSSTNENFQKILKDFSYGVT